MKKKTATVFTALACAGILTCACALTACGGGRETIYNKTFTITGEHTTDWTGKNFSDNYGSLGSDVSQKKIIETYWDDIDWEYMSIEQPANVDALITMVDGALIFKELEGLAFSFSGKDDLKLTLTLPESFSYWGYGTTVEMPFAQTEAEFNAFDVSLVHEYGTKQVYFDSEGVGYGGFGVKKNADGFLLVEFKVGYNGINFALTKFENNGESNRITQEIASRELCPTLQGKEKVDGSSSTRSDVIKISLYPKYTVTKK